MEANLASVDQRIASRFQARLASHIALKKKKATNPLA